MLNKINVLRHGKSVINTQDQTCTYYTLYVVMNGSLGQRSCLQFADHCCLVCTVDIIKSSLLALSSPTLRYVMSTNHTLGCFPSSVARGVCLQKTASRDRNKLRRK